MADVTVIGRGTRIRGRISGAVDLEIQGHVDGEIAIDGDVTVDTEGLVGASVAGRRVIVRGAVRGDLVGEDAIVLEDGARVLGDLRAPRIAVAQGALVKGHVQTGDADAAAPPRARPQPAARPVVRPAEARPAPARPAPAPRAAAAPPARPAVTSHAVRTPLTLAGGAPSAASKPAGPPAPVVPALKKGAKGALKKKNA